MIPYLHKSFSIRFANRPVLCRNIITFFFKQRKGMMEIRKIRSLKKKIEDENQRYFRKYIQDRDHEIQHEFQLFILVKNPVLLCE